MRKAILQLKNLDELPEILDQMISQQKEKKTKTYVARYKGKNLILRSGRSSWRAIHHAKSALLCHFEHQESLYKYFPHGKYAENGKINPFTTEGSEEREKEFRAKLFELIEIVELSE